MIKPTSIGKRDIEGLSLAITQKFNEFLLLAGDSPLEEEFENLRGVVASILRGESAPEPEATEAMLLVPETYGHAVQQFGESFLVGRENHLWDNATKVENLAWILERIKVKPRFKLGAHVHVDHPRFHGYGIVQYDTGEHVRNVGVKLENGNIWEYEIETVTAVPEQQTLIATPEPTP